MVPQHPRMGWKKDMYDHRDFLHVTGSYPDTFSLFPLAEAVGDQDGVGACTGFGVGGTLSSEAKRAGAYTEKFSENWIYNGARYIEGTLTQDAGAYPKDCFDWVLKKGCLLSHFWPFQDRLDPQAPPSKYDPEAAKWPIVTYTRIVDSVDGICSALSSGNPGGAFVAIGSPWFSAWMNPASDGVLAQVTPNSSIAGGHETRLYGYDKPNNVFLGRNSWGAGWGKAGDYVMPMSAIDVFKACGGYDAHYVTVQWSATPPPAPAKLVLRLQESKDSGKSWKTLSQVTP